VSRSAISGLRNMTFHGPAMPLVDCFRISAAARRCSSFSVSLVSCGKRSLPACAQATGAPSIRAAPITTMSNAIVTIRII
jgi:hypothetical protein